MIEIGMIFKDNDPGSCETLEFLGSILEFINNRLNLNKFKFEIKFTNGAKTGI